jgi:hypothetical protein
MIMDLNDWAEVATIVGVLSIPLSGFFIWLQLRQQTELAKLANAQALVELSSPFNLELIKDPQMAEYWVLGAKNYKNYDEVGQYRFKSLLIWWLILHENIFFQWRRGMLDEAVYKPWKYDLELFCHDQLGSLWPELKSPFQAEFVKHIDELLKKPK